MEYKVKQTSEDESAVIIEKSGQVSEFTVADVRSNRKDLEKTLKQIKGQKELEDAKVTNIKEHNPFVLDMSEKDLHAAYMYWEAYAISKVCEKKIKEIEDALTKGEQEIKDIKEQTGIEI